MIRILDAKLQNIKESHIKYFEESGLKLLQNYAARTNQKEKEKEKEKETKIWGYLEENYKKVLTGRPNELETIISEIKKINKGNSLKKGLILSMMKVFDYDKFSSRSPGVSGENWGAFLFVKKLNVIVCPYCNRQYIHAYRMKTDDELKNGQTRAVLDHYFDKATYPFLALSLYNLIPCCKVCNSDFKGSKSFTLENFLHPYHNGFEDKVRFTVKPPIVTKSDGSKEVDIIALLNRKEIEIDIRILDADPAFIKQVNNTTNLFKLRELYNLHVDYIAEIIQKAYHYTPETIDHLFKSSGVAFQTRDEIARFALGNYIFKEDNGKRVLSKLTEDVSEELGLLQRFIDLDLS